MNNLFKNTYRGDSNDNERYSGLHILVNGQPLPTEEVHSCYIQCSRERRALEREGASWSEAGLFESNCRDNCWEAHRQSLLQPPLNGGGGNGGGGNGNGEGTDTQTIIIWTSVALLLIALIIGGAIAIKKIRT